MNELTRKQEKFVDTFVETGNGTQSALAAYDTEDLNTAGVIAHENLRKPKVAEAIIRELTEREKLVEEAHESLLTAVRLDYFVFPRKMDDIEIEGHLKAQGLTCINIRPSEKGKLAFFSLPDGASRAKGIEIHHKVEGTFAPEKRVTLNLEVEASPRLKAISKRINEALRPNGRRMGSNGAPASDMGSEARNKDGDRPTS